MSHANRRRLRVTAAVAAGAIAVAGTLVASWATLAQAAPARQSAAITSRSEIAGLYTNTESGNTGGSPATPIGRTVTRLPLEAMPAGTIMTGTTAAGQQFVTVSVFGLTPGSAHEVTLRGNPIGTLTADATGVATQTFTVPGIRLFDRVRILDGGRGSGVIAVSAATGSGNGPYPLQANEPGFPTGSLHGSATLVFDPATATITVTLSAWGVSPGSHAAHIHLGSCASQGPVRHMLKDFYANGAGRISDETRVITGVTAPPPFTGWYLNLHQGNSSDIASNGQPTINFRPLLCANIAG